MNEDRINEHYFGDLSDAAVLRCRERIHWICKQAKGQKVLDIGCSQGIVSLILGREGFECSGIDIEQASLAFARKELKKEDEIVRNRVKFRLADASALPFNDNLFDSVILGEILEHLTHPDKVLREAHRVLKDRGGVIITVPYGLHPYHDHKQTYYPISFVKLLQPYFQTGTVKVLNNYILYCGVKQAVSESADSVEDTAFTLSRWEAELESRCLEKEIALFETGTKLYAEIRALNEQIKTLQATIQTEVDKAAQKEKDLAKLIKLNTQNLDEVNKEWQEKLRIVEHDFTSRISAKDEEIASTRSHTEEVLARSDEEWQEKLQLLEQDFISRLEARDKELRELQSRIATTKQSGENELRESASKQQAEWKKSLQVQKIKEVVRHSVPAGANVIVVSKGDDNLLNLEGRYGWHFPQTLGGVYAGYHPANSANAIADLEALHARGAGFLLIPSAAFWWLDHYAEFRQHLDNNYQLIAYHEDACLIYALRADGEHQPRVQIVEAKLPSRAQSLPPNTRVASTPIETSAQSKGPTVMFDKAKPSIAAILDEFTSACFQPEGNLITFRPDNWKEVLREHDMDMLLVESAWRGNDGGWQYKIASYDKPMGDELAQLVKYCNSRRIPTVFWNKEDPSHFNRFIDKASLFDYVFTSDSDCITKYRKRLRHDRIFPLPFAAQPKIHNPINGKRKFNVCFAGAYYGIDHDERQLDMEHVLRPALDYGLHIYDRQHGLVGQLAEQFQFPEIYRPAIKGRLEYDEMQKAYKNYKVFLNVNSVKTSPTMFSRRVFELLACGTPVVSAYAKGIEKLLGRDVVLITRSEKETRRHLDLLLTDANEWARISTKGIRRVLEEHTYAARLNQIRETLGLKLTKPKPVRITVVAKPRTRLDVRRMIETLKGQTYRKLELLVVLDKELKETDLHPVAIALPDVPVHIFSQAKNGLEQCVKAITGEYFWVLNFDDYYGPNFLKDCVLATTYSDADAIGKHSHFQAPAAANRFELACPGRDFNQVTSLPSGSFILRTVARMGNDIRALLSNRSLQFRKKQLLSIDRFNYVKGAYASESIGSQRLKKLASEISV